MKSLRDAIAAQTAKGSSLSRAWVEDPEAPSTLEEAVLGGFDAIVAEHLNEVRNEVQVTRGPVSSVEFWRDLTPAMLGQLSVDDRAWLQAALAGGAIDLDGPAVVAILEPIGYPLTRPGSLAEQALGLGRTVTHEQIAELDLDKRSEDVRVGIVKVERITLEGSEKELADGRIVRTHQTLTDDGQILDKPAAAEVIP